jgi:uncharacterized protein (TIGR00299 family) protein
LGRVLFVDVVGGAAGDMLLAALLDAGADESFVRQAVEAVVPGRFGFDVEPAVRAGHRASYLRIAPLGDGPDAPRSLEDLVAAVDRADLQPEVQDRARRVLEALGRAESRVHGFDHIELQALGNDDTLLDVVGFAAAIASLEVERVMVSPIPLGHGPEAVGPATLQLLQGFDIRPAPAGAGERVTPTAAAIFAALGAVATAAPAMRLEAVGYGAGTRDPSGFANVVRVLVGTPADEGVGASDTDEFALRRRTLGMLEANLDDMTPELVADAAEALLAAGALDVWTTPIQMKKGRSAVTLSALCEPQDESRILGTFFEATSTFGVRRHPVERTELERRSVAVPVAGGTVRVKLGVLGSRILSATPEHDDVASLARRVGRPVREVYEEAVVAARALRFEPADE